MDSTALALVIAGAFCHAAWNLLAKQAGGGLPFVWLFGLVGAVLALPFGVFAWLRFAGEIGGAGWAAIVLSAAIHAVYSLVLQTGYRLADFSVVYPLARGTGPLFSVAGAVLLLGEMPRPAGWCGIAALLAGIFLIAGIGKLGGAPSPTLRAGLRWGCLTGLCIAAYTLLDGWAIKQLGLTPLLFYALGLPIRTLVLAPHALRQPARLAEQWRVNRAAIVGVGVLSPLAYLLVLQALTRAPLSYIAPLRELSMLLAVFLGARLLREPFTRGRLAGTFCMIAGVVLLALA